MYYHTRLKRSERPHEMLEFAVMDDYSNVAAYCETEDQAILIVHAVNNRVAVGDSKSGAAKADSEDA